MAERMIRACLWALIELSITLAATLSLGVEVRPEIVDDSVDVIEVNHNHDREGKLLYSQMIFLEWNPTDSLYEVRDWVKLSNPTHRPFRHPNGLWVCILHDNEGRILRRIWSRQVRETWTFHDPEIMALNRRPVQDRRLLILSSRRITPWPKPE